MKMPTRIETDMFAPCGMNCKVCYRHCGHKKPCDGCLKSDDGKPEHCRKCGVKDCARQHGVIYCFACPEFPCKRIKSFEKSYNRRYQASLVDNSKSVREQGLERFMCAQRERYTCRKCAGIISLHDRACSECGERMQGMHINEAVEMLYAKNNTLAYGALKELLEASEQSDAVYAYMEKFVEMMDHESAYVRNRGLALIAAQACWDAENRIDEVIDGYLKHITDVKPTTSRQCIKWLPIIAQHKPDLRRNVVDALRSANVSRYEDSMRPLVQKDIGHALEVIEKGEA